MKVTKSEVGRPSQVPPRVDLAALVKELQVHGRHSETKDELWVGKIGLTNMGEILLDGRVRGVSFDEIGAGVEAFKALLQQHGLKLTSSGRRPIKRRMPKPREPRHQRDKAEQAVGRVLNFLFARDLRAEFFSSTTLVIAPGVSRLIKYNAHSGRIKVEGEKTYPVRGLVALACVLAREARHPEFGHLYPRSMQKVDVTSPEIAVALENSLERRWATTLSAQAMTRAFA